MDAFPTPLIRMEGVHKVFYTSEVETHALTDVCLEVRKGEYVSISGPSGCGKSTLLSILGLLDTPTAGRYWLGGQDVSALRGAELTRLRGRQIGFIFQSFNLIRQLTVHENVELPLTYQGVPSRESRRRVVEVLEQVRLDHRRHHYPYQLSGGQQQRVAVARAIACRPLLLLADEPTGNLDSENGLAVMKLLDELHQDGATICMVTHDQRFARRAWRNVELFDGAIQGETLAEEWLEEEMREAV